MSCLPKYGNLLWTYAKNNGCTLRYSKPQLVNGGMAPPPRRGLPGTVCFMVIVTLNDDDHFGFGATGSIAKHYAEKEAYNSVIPKDKQDSDLDTDTDLEIVEAIEVTSAYQQAAGGFQPVENEVTSDLEGNQVHKHLDCTTGEGSDATVKGYCSIPYEHSNEPSESNTEYTVPQTYEEVTAMLEKVPPAQLPSDNMVWVRAPSRDIVQALYDTANMKGLTVSFQYRKCGPKESSKVLVRAYAGGFRSEGRHFRQYMAKCEAAASLLASIRHLPDVSYHNQSSTQEYGDKQSHIQGNQIPAAYEPQDQPSDINNQSAGAWIPQDRPSEAHVPQVASESYVTQDHYVESHSQGYALQPQSSEAYMQQTGHYIQHSEACVPQDPSSQQVYTPQSHETYVEHYQSSVPKVQNQDTSTPQHQHSENSVQPYPEQSLNAGSLRAQEHVEDTMSQSQHGDESDQPGSGVQQAESAAVHILQDQPSTSVVPEQRRKTRLSKSPSPATSVGSDLSSARMKNPVSLLNELFQADRGDKPQYEFSRNKVDTLTEFTCVASMKGLSAKGIGVSNVIAKRHAAENLLVLLQLQGMTIPKGMKAKRPQSKFPRSPYSRDAPYRPYQTQHGAEYTYSGHFPPHQTSAHLPYRPQPTYHPPEPHHLTPSHSHLKLPPIPPPHPPHPPPTLTPLNLPSNATQAREEMRQFTSHFMKQFPSKANTPMGSPTKFSSHTHRPDSANFSPAQVLRPSQPHRRPLTPRYPHAILNRPPCPRLPPPPRTPLARYRPPSPHPLRPPSLHIPQALQPHIEWDSPLREANDKGAWFSPGLQEVLPSPAQNAKDQTELTENFDNLKVGQPESVSTNVSSNNASQGNRGSQQSSVLASSNPSSSQSASSLSSDSQQGLSSQQHPQKAEGSNSESEIKTHDETSDPLQFYTRLPQKRKTPWSMEVQRPQAIDKDIFAKLRRKELESNLVTANPGLTQTRNSSGFGAASETPARYGAVYRNSGPIENKTPPWILPDSEMWGEVEDTVMKPSVSIESKLPSEDATFHQTVSVVANTPPENKAPREVTALNQSATEKTLSFEDTVITSGVEKEIWGEQAVCPTGEEASLPMETEHIYIGSQDMMISAETEQVSVKQYNPQDTVLLSVNEQVITPDSEGEASFSVLSEFWGEQAVCPSGEEAALRTDTEHGSLLRPRRKEARLSAETVQEQPSLQKAALPLNEHLISPTIQREAAVSELWGEQAVCPSSEEAALPSGTEHISVMKPQEAEHPLESEQLPAIQPGNDELASESSRKQQATFSSEQSVQDTPERQPSTNQLLFQYSASLPSDEDLGFPLVSDFWYDKVVFTGPSIEETALPQSMALPIESSHQAVQHHANLVDSDCVNATALTDNSLWQTLLELEDSIMIPECEMLNEAFDVPSFRTENKTTTPSTGRECIVATPLYDKYTTPQLVFGVATHVVAVDNDVATPPDDSRETETIPLSSDDQSQAGSESPVIEEMSSWKKGLPHIPPLVSCFSPPATPIDRSSPPDSVNPSVPGVYYVTEIESSPHNLSHSPSPYFADLPLEREGLSPMQNDRALKEDADKSSCMYRFNRQCSVMDDSNAKLPSEGSLKTVASILQ